MKKLLCLILIPLFVGCAKYETVSTESGGDSSSGGGSGVEAEFQVAAARCLAYVWRNSAIVLSAGSATSGYKRMKMVVDNLKVEATNKILYVNGKPKSAVNYPERLLVRINIADWKQMDRESKMVLTMHELMGLAFTKEELDDTDFVYSKTMIGKLGFIDYMPLYENTDKTDP